VKQPLATGLAVILLLSGCSSQPEQKDANPEPRTDGTKDAEPRKLVISCDFSQGKQRLDETMEEIARRAAKNIVVEPSVGGRLIDTATFPSQNSWRAAVELAAAKTDCVVEEDASGVIFIRPRPVH
jgi:hypothetical protein